MTDPNPPADALDLDPRTKAALLLAQGYSTDRAGAAVGVNGRTVRRWRETDAEFCDTIAKARAAILDQTVAGLASLARDSVEVLRACLGDESSSIRLRAALGALGALPAVTSHVELEERIAALERGDNPRFTNAEIDRELERLQKQGEREGWTS